MDRTPSARRNDADRDEADRNAESGRISRSGTEAGISIGSESTSGGADPIEPGVHEQPTDPPHTTGGDSKQKPARRRE